MATLKINTTNLELLAPAIQAFHRAYAAQFPDNATNMYDCLELPTVDMELVVTDKILEANGNVRTKDLKTLTEIIQHHQAKKGDKRSYNINEARKLALAACSRLFGYVARNPNSQPSHIPRSTSVIVLCFEAGWFDPENVFHPSYELEQTQRIIKESGLEAILKVV
jgi:hypothetical protein